jgi:hypothetical protein
MSNTDPVTFVPVLTVMPDYGMAPFLWLVDRPDQGGVGGMLCDGTAWDESFPMSEGLWRKFADWAIAFDRTAFYSDDFDADGWDWLAFHARGLQLARWLKEEVGDAYRVVYDKPCEDPNHCLDERREVLTDGTLIPLPPLPDPVPEPPRLCRRTVSGSWLSFPRRSGGGHRPQCRPHRTRQGAGACPAQCLETVATTRLGGRIRCPVRGLERGRWIPTDGD